MIYAAALTWSHLSDAAEPAIAASPVRVAHEDTSAATLDGELPVILLVHGSPGSRRDFRRMTPFLARRARVIAPDLPGFGASPHRVADYSIAAHARDVHRLLTDLGLPAVHVVGFSMGGGVALELAALATDRVASVTMLSAIGVQEMELFGAHRPNRLVHAVQLAGVWGMFNLVPHFGFIRDGGIDVPYARNFYDTDQRPLRQRLEALEVPALIVHGARDVLVPAAAAIEHHRIVPQSELAMVDGDHFIAFSQAEKVAAVIGDFVTRAERGEAVRRGAASEARQQAAARRFDPRDIPPLMAIGLGVVGLAAMASATTWPGLTVTALATGIGLGRIGATTGTLVWLAAAVAIGVVLGRRGRRGGLRRRLVSAAVIGLALGWPLAGTGAGLVLWEVAVTALLAAGLIAPVRAAARIVGRALPKSPPSGAP